MGKTEKKNIPKHEMIKHGKKNSIKCLTRITLFSQFVLCFPNLSCRQGRNLWGQWWNSHNASNTVCQWWMKLRSILNTPAVMWVCRWRVGCLAAVNMREVGTGGVFGTRNRRALLVLRTGKQGVGKAQRVEALWLYQISHWVQVQQVERWAVLCMEDGAGWEKRDEAGYLMCTICTVFLRKGHYWFWSLRFFLPMLCCHIMFITLKHAVI